MALDDIDHIVYVMLENRSFDHMLGYLSLPGSKPPLKLDGLRSDPVWLQSWANLGDGKPFPLNALTSDPEIEDPPHGSVRIRQQIHTPTANGAQPLMGGFVQSYLDSRRFDAKTGLPLKKQKKVKKPGAVMSYHQAKTVPTFEFFARNFCVCDKWFTPLPLGTQANRLMAMAGESDLTDNNTLGFPDQFLVYDWLDRVVGEGSWRVYTWGGFVPFFTLMPRMRRQIARGLLGFGPFKRFSRFADDWKGDADMPPVIFLEPEYGDGPGDRPNDDHPPVGVAGGQDFLNRIYQILTSNEARWAKTLLIVTYDEHGGFFDHVPPLAIKWDAGGVEFDTTGPRVPALLVSPHVESASTFSEPLDHTSFLQLLDERFNGGRGYSDAVSRRTELLKGRLTRALKPPRPGPAPKLGPPKEVKGITVGRAVHAFNAGFRYWAPETPNGVAYDNAIRSLAAEHPEILKSDANREIADYLDTERPRPRSLDFIQ